MLMSIDYNYNNKNIYQNPLLKMLNKKIKFILKFLILALTIFTLDAPLALTKNALGSELSIENRYELNEQINLNYSVRSLGLNIASVELDFNLSDSKYWSNTKIKAKGIGGIFSSTEWTFASRGNLEKKKISPKFYSNHITTKKGKGYVSITYRTELLTIYALPENDKEREDLLAIHLDTKTKDPLSTIIEISLYKIDNPCVGQWKITDGRRVFSLVFRKLDLSKKAEDLIGCEVKYTPIAGQSDKELEDEKDNPSPYHKIWLSKIKINNQMDILIPVMIHAKTDLGITKIELDDITINDINIVL
jgi:hypothetical protein